MEMDEIEIISKRRHQRSKVISTFFQSVSQNQLLNGDKEEKEDEPIIRTLGGSERGNMKYNSSGVLLDSELLCKSDRSPRVPRKNVQETIQCSGCAISSDPWGVMI